MSRRGSFSIYEWVILLLVLMGFCGGCQSLWTPSSAAAGGLAGAAVGGPFGAAVGAGAGAAGSELLIKGDAIDQLEKRDRQRDAEYQAFVAEVVASATPEVRDQIAGSLSQSAIEREKRLADETKGFAEKIEEKLLGLFWLAVYSIIGWLALTQVLPVVISTWKKKKRPK